MFEIIISAIKGGSNDREFLRMFKTSRELISGYGVVSGPGTYNWSPDHAAGAPGFMLSGECSSSRRIMPLVDVRRVTDADKVALDLVIPFNGSFRSILVGTI